MPRATALEQLLRRDRAVVIGGLALAAGLAWIFVLTGAGMDGFMSAGRDGSGMAMSGMTMPAASWSATYFLAMLIMWTVMMMAMMLPGAAPMMLLFATLERKQRERSTPYVPTSLFTLGYAVVWLGFSALATTAQWELGRLALLSSALAVTNAVLAGFVLLAAGAYQLSSLKETCLRNCRSPLDFLTRHWRGGRRGAVVMGLVHGLYCLGCCWMLMMLLFVGGIMNFLWVAGIAVYVLLEKTLPAGRWMGSAAGILLIGWGGVALALALG